jgi:DNA-binding NtrC family response regulator
LLRQPWNGNVRELRNAVERAATLSPRDVLTASDFVAEELVGTRGPVVTLPPCGIDVEDVLDDLVRQALERTRGNRSAAGRLLRMSRDRIRLRMGRPAFRSRRPR